MGGTRNNSHHPTRRTLLNCRHFILLVLFIISSCFDISNGDSIDYQAADSFLDASFLNAAGGGVRKDSGSSDLQAIITIKSDELIKEITRQALFESCSNCINIPCNLDYDPACNLKVYYNLDFDVMSFQLNVKTPSKPTWLAIGLNSKRKMIGTDSLIIKLDEEFEIYNGEIKYYNAPRASGLNMSNIFKYEYNGRTTISFDRPLVGVNKKRFDVNKCQHIVVADGMIVNGNMLIHHHTPKFTAACYFISDYRESLFKTIKPTTSEPISSNKPKSYQPTTPEILATLSTTSVPPTSVKYDVNNLDISSLEIEFELNEKNMTANDSHIEIGVDLVHTPAESVVSSTQPTVSTDFYEFDLITSTNPPPSNQDSSSSPAPSSSFTFIYEKPDTQTPSVAASTTLQPIVETFITSDTIQSTTPTPTFFFEFESTEPSAMSTVKPTYHFIYEPDYSDLEAAEQGSDSSPSTHMIVDLDIKSEPSSLTTPSAILTTKLDATTTVTESVDELMSVEATTMTIIQTSTQVVIESSTESSYIIETTTVDNSDGETKPTTSESDFLSHLFNLYKNVSQTIIKSNTSFSLNQSSSLLTDFLSEIKDMNSIFKTNETTSDEPTVSSTTTEETTTTVNNQFKLKIDSIQSTQTQTSTEETTTSSETTTQISTTQITTEQVTTSKVVTTEPPTTTFIASSTTEETTTIITTSTESTTLETTSRSTTVPVTTTVRSTSTSSSSSSSTTIVSSTAIITKKIAASSTIISIKEVTIEPNTTRASSSSKPSSSSSSSLFKVKIRFDLNATDELKKLKGLVKSFLVNSLAEGDGLPSYYDLFLDRFYHTRENKTLEVQAILNFKNASQNVSQNNELIRRVKMAFVNSSSAEVVNDGLRVREDSVLIEPYQNDTVFQKPRSHSDTFIITITLSSVFGYLTLMFIIIISLVVYYLLKRNKSNKYYVPHKVKYQVTRI